jgi:hypothetical protein
LGSLRGRDIWEDLDVDGRIMEIGVEGNWISLAQDRVRWRALVNSVMNLRVR